MIRLDSLRLCWLDPAARVLGVLTKESDWMRTESHDLGLKTGSLLTSPPWLTGKSVPDCFAGPAALPILTDKRVFR